MAGERPDRATDAGGAAQGLRPGERVQAWAGEVVHWSGTVETVSAELGVVWIREDGMGARRLLDLDEHQVRPEAPGGA